MSTVIPFPAPIDSATERLICLSAALADLALCPVTNSTRAEIIALAENIRALAAAN